MSKKVTAQSLQIKPRQPLEVPAFTQFLDAHLDIRHNNCLLWTLQDDASDTPKDKVEIIMVRIDETLEPVNAKYIGNFKDNGGARHVFVIREAEKLAIFGGGK